jgi:hypothetical protein
MVIRREQAGGEGGVICIPQSQHAAIAGQMARAWGNVDFPVPEPEDSVCMAAERHDDGMIAFDRDPERDPETGLPRDFMKMPLETWLECWRRGPREVADDHPYAGLLVSLHGVHLLGYRKIDSGDEGAQRLVEDYRDEQAALQEELREAAARIPACEPCLADERIETNRRLIAAWDAMSLAVCMPRLPDDVEAVPLERGEMTIRIKSVGGVGGDQEVIEVDPWPFSADTVPLAAAGRRLDGPEPDQEALDRALEEAPLRTLDFTLVPPDDAGDSAQSPSEELPI